MSRFSKIIIGLYGASLFLWAFLWKGRLPYHIDTRLYAYPDHAFNLRCFHDGFIPLWNPFIGCGVPHLADWQSACFYPPFWLFNLTGLDDWLMWMALAHAGLAFGGCYLWLRSQKAASLWAALGAFSFAGSAHLVSCWANLPFIATAAWIPWLFWTAQRAVSKHALKSSKARTSGTAFSNWALFGVCVTLQILAGYPFFTFYTLAALVVWFLLQRPSAKDSYGFGAALGLAALATALQWLPFLEFLTYSWHDSWNEFPYYTKPVEYLTLLRPDILGFPGDAAYKGSFANAPFNLYLGLVPLVTLGCCFFLSFLSRKGSWAWGAFFLLLWTAGGRLFLWRWIPEPLLEFLEPSKAAGLFVFTAVTSAAQGLSQAKWIQKPAWRWVGPLLAVLWVADLLSVPFLLEKPMPDPFLSPVLQRRAEGLSQDLQGSRMVSLHPSQEMTYSGETALQDSFERPTALFLPNSNVAWGLRSADQYLYLQVEGTQNFTRYVNKGFSLGYRGGLFDVAGVRLLLMPQVPPGGKYELFTRWGDDLLLLNPGASPDMRWVPQALDFPTRPDVLDKLSLDDHAWENAVYLQRNADGTRVGWGPLSRKRAGPVPPGFSRPAATRASLAEDLPEAGYLVFNETFAPGWHAWVDGSPRSILRAYGLFMAVPVPAGTHQVEFRYEPASFRLGLFMTLATLGMVLALLFSKRKRSQFNRR